MDRCVLYTLILAACAASICRAASIAQVESRPIDGNQFTEGQAFRFVCKAVGNQALAVRLHCPLSDYAPQPLKANACYENCGRPLCDQPALNDCAETLPELLNSDCTRQVRQLSGDIQEITVEYVFRSVSLRNQGVYACQYTNVRSSVAVSIEATTTTKTTTTSTVATTTATTTQPTTSTTKSTTLTATTPTTTAMASSSSAATVYSATTQKATYGARVVTTRPESGANPAVKANDGGTFVSSPAPDREGNGKVTTVQAMDDEVQLKQSGWFYSSLVGKLVGIDIVLMVMLIVLVILMIGGFLLIRCQVSSARQRATSTTKRPLQPCCAALLCIGGDVDGGGGASGSGGAGSKRSNGYHPSKLRSERPQIQAFPHGGGSDAASGQVYSEANLDSSYYSQGESDRLPGDDAYYRLQTHFDGADPRLQVGGSQRGGGGGGFFNRDAQDRHSFHNVRASRQRPAIPADLLLRPGAAEGGGASELSREAIREQVVQQRREIDQLRQQLRDSQQQLTRLASSQQELNRSASFSRMPTVTAARGPAAATTPDSEPVGVAADDYELLSKATTPTTELPSFASDSVNGGGVGGGHRGSADLLLSIDEPIEEEEDPADQVEYPTVRSKRRSSIGEAYAAERLCLT